MCGVGIGKNHTYHQRDNIKKWLLTKVIPRLIHLGFYGQEPALDGDDISFVTPQFLEDYKQQFLSKIGYLEQTNQELLSYLQRQQQVTDVLSLFQTHLIQLEFQQRQILELIEVLSQSQYSLANMSPENAKKPLKNSFKKWLINSFS